MRNRIVFGKKLDPDVNYHITSDQHLHHHNVLRFCPQTRGAWKDIHEMEEGLVQHWNANVGENDVVFHLGDFSFSKDHNEIRRIISRLNGHIIFILGNHDKIIRTQLDVEKYDYLEVRFDGRDIIMSHYPIYEWNKCHYGSLHFYGHQHGKNNPDLGRSMDVGIDKHARILPLQEAVDMIKYNEIHSYH